MRAVKNVIPAKAGISTYLISLDPRLRRDDKKPFIILPFIRNGMENS